MKFAYTLLTTLFMTSMITTSHADELTPAKKADILKLLSLNGTEHIVDPLSMLVTQSFMQSLRNCTTCSPKIPDVVHAETLAVLRSHVSGEDGLIARQVPIFDKHFTHAEIKQLLAFYGSPIGKKLVGETNPLTTETIQTSQQWLTEVAPEIKQHIDVALTKAGIKPQLPGSPPPSVLQSQPAK
jgi:hypothetical protein